MAGRKKIKLEHFCLASRQYSSRVGVLTQQAGSLKFAEIKFDPADTALTDFLTNDIRLNDNSTLLPRRALGRYMKVVRLRPSNLPFLNDKALLAGLKKSLKHYGDILDIGILPEPTTGTYMYTDYAVLNVTSETKKFKSLTHLIPWGEKEEYGFYAVWIQTPHYYRYCYEGSHVVINCSKRPARHTCWDCSVHGHVATSCIHDKPSKHALEQLETGDVAQSSVDSDPTLPKSTKFIETKNTPTKGTEFQPMTEAQVPYDETLMHDPPVVISTPPPPLSTPTSSITISPGRTGPKHSRMHAAQKSYERPVARSQSILPKEPIYVPSASMQVGQTDTMITDSPMDSSSSVTQVDEGPATPMQQ